MKRFLSFLMAASLVMGFAACKEDNTEDNPGITEETKPVFPEAVTGVIEASGKDNGFKFTVSGNIDWSVTLAENTDNWFILTDGVAENPTYYGSADESKTFIVYTDYEESFDGHSCQVMMTMGDQSKAVAYISQGTIEREFSLYAAEFDKKEGYFVFSPNGGYEFQPVESGVDIELYFQFGSSMYQRPIAFNTNFDWEIKSAPEWIDMVNEKTDAEGRVSMDLRAANYKIADPTGEIVFADKNDGNATFTYTITIPEYGNYFDMIPQTVAEFNAEGLWYNQDSWTETTPSSTITTTAGYRIFAYAKVNEDSGSYYDIHQDWLSATTRGDVDDYNDESDWYIRSFRIDVSVTPNTKDEKREGIVMVVPAYVINPIIEEHPEYTEEELAAQFAGNVVAPEYDKYVLYYVSQKENEPTPIITAVTPEPDMRLYGAYFSNAEKDAWFIRGSNSFRGLSYFYQLAYSAKIADDNTPMFRLADEYYESKISFEYYDSNAMPMSDTWLDAKYVEYKEEASEDGVEVEPIWVVRIQMDPDKDNYQGFDYQHEGFVVIKSGETPVACIYCIFDESFQPADPDAESKKISFATPEAVEGAELVTITKNNYVQYGISDSEYNEAYGQRTALYYLIYTSDSPKNAALTTPAGYTIMVMPYGIPWLQTNPGDYEKTSTQMTVTMTAPEEDYSTKVGRINLYKSLSESKVDITIYCKPAFALNE